MDMRHTGRYIFILAAGILMAIMLMPARAQQLPDMEFHFEIKIPAYGNGKGPKLLIDKAHSPYIQRGSFEPLLRLVREDGYRADYLETKITKETLANVQILVIANAYREDFAKFSIMQPPSAYEPQEIDVIRDWVTAGGRLLLIADHAPFSGGTSQLAEAFGFTFFNAYVLKEALLPRSSGEITYRPLGGLNTNHPIVKSLPEAEKFDHFVIFTGSAFIAPDGAKSVLTVPGGYVAVMTGNIRNEAANAPRINVSGLSQGATMELDRGRLAVFAEAGSFTAQIVNGTRRFGMNVERAKQNPLFVLATMGWLAEGL